MKHSLRHLPPDEYERLQWIEESLGAVPLETDSPAKGSLQANLKRLQEPIRAAGRFAMKGLEVATPYINLPLELITSIPSLVPGQQAGEELGQATYSDLKDLLGGETEFGEFMESVNQRQTEDRSMITQLGVGAFVPIVPGASFVAKSPAAVHLLRGIKGAVRAGKSSIIQRPLADLQDFDGLVEMAFREDGFRKIANMPVIRNVAGVFNPSSVANDSTHRFLAGSAALREEGANKAAVAFQDLARLGGQRKVFGPVDNQGLLTKGELKGKSLNDVRTYPDRYPLTAKQKQWIEQADALERSKLKFLEDNGILITELTFEEGGQYAGRRVFAKVTKDGELLDIGYMSPGPGRPGAKLGLEKKRMFDTEEEAIEQGYRYLNDEDALYYNLQGAYNRVADKKAADWLLEQVDWRTSAAPEGMKIAAEAARNKVAKAKKLLAVTNRAFRGERVPEVSIKSLDGLFAEEAQAVRELIGDVQAAARPKLPRKRTIDELRQAGGLQRPPGRSSQAIEGAIQEAIHEQSLLRRVEGKSKRVFDDLDEFSLDEVEFLEEIVGKDIADIRFADVQVAARRGIGEFETELGRLRADLQERIALESETEAAAIQRGIDRIGLEEVVDLPMPAERLSVLRDRVKTLIGDAQDEAQTASARVVKHEREALEGQIAAPAFAGKILTGPEGAEIARVINRSMDPLFFEALNSINKVNALARFFQLAGDVSPMGIQLLFWLGSKPKIYGQAGIGFVRAMVDPAFHAKYLSKNADVIRGSRNLLTTVRGTEFTEAAGRGGILQAKMLAPARIALAPFQRGFEASLDVAGIELKKAMGYRTFGMKDADAMLDDFINEFRGLASSAKLGTSPFTRQVETLALLAPRYNRAIAALLFDVFRGNLRGELAREHLAKGVGALMAFTVAIGKANGETDREIAEHFNPWSDKFFTWMVAGQNIGPGTKVRSIVKLFAQTAADPTSLFDKAMENPALRWMRGNTSPFIQEGIDLWTGKDYMGDPVRDGLLSFSKHIAKRFMPIYIASMALEGGDLEGRMVRGGAEFGGWRGYPFSPSQVRNEVRAKIQAEMGLGDDWDKLNPFERHQVNNHPEVVKAQKAVQDKGLARQDDYAEYRQKDTDIRDWAKNAIETEFEQYGYSERTRERIDKVETERAIRVNQLRKDNAEALEFLADLEPRKSEVDQAIAVYRLAMNDEKNPWIDPDTREPDFQKRDEILSDLREELGSDLLEQVEEAIHLNDPPLVKELRAARKFLRPYWDIMRDEIEKAAKDEPRITAAYEKWLEASDQERTELLKVGTPREVWEYLDEVMKMVRAGPATLDAAGNLTGGYHGIDGISARFLRDNDPEYERTLYRWGWLSRRDPVTDVVAIEEGEKFDAMRRRGEMDLPQAVGPVGPER